MVKLSKWAAAILFAALMTFNAHGQLSETERSWNLPVEPFRIIGNVYYVGASDIASYLIATPKGHILIDSGFLETVPQIEQNIAKLGLKLSDIKILLNSHAHYDHAGGLAELRRRTGARLYISEPDAPLMARGGKDDPNFDDRFPYEPTTPDVTFRDRRVIKLGGARLRAHITAGHTQGCTTWQAEVNDRGVKKNVVFVCSTSAPGYQLAANKGYPNIAVDYERTFARLREIKADVFLGSHGSIFGLLEKMKVLKEDPGATPFIDPDGYLKYLELSEKRFCEMLEAQQLEAQQNIKN